MVEMMEEEVHLSGAERALAGISGAVLGASVGFYLLHGIPGLTAIGVSLYGIGIGLGGVDQFMKRERAEWKQRFSDGA